ncbi:MAG: hypothetical protein AAFU70_08240, partial [Planctomycetota bacterium]
LDRRTGQVLETVAANPLGSPSYIARSDRDLVLMLENQRIGVLPLDDLSGRSYKRSPQLPGGRIVGRALLAGRTVVIPVASGVATVDLDDFNRAPQLIRLDQPGAIDIADGQIVTVLDGVARGYLAWDVAEALLRERIAESPADPGPATTLADLAFRAGREPEIIGAVEIAAGIATFPDDRTRLFDTVRTIIESSQHAWLARAAGETFDGPSVLDPARLETLTDTLGRFARSPEQIVAFQLADGRLREMLADDAAALAAYQRVLGEPELAVAPWTGPTATLRAELEASRRVRELVARAGLEIYEPYALEASAALEAAPQDDEDELERIARGYALAPAAADAWLRIAEAEAETKPIEAVRATERALQVIALRRAAGGDPDDRLLGRALGARVQLLLAQDRIAEAADVLRAAAREHPDVTLLAGDTVLDVDSTLASIARSLAERQALARIGDPVFEAEPALIGGHLLLPLIHDTDDSASPAPDTFAEALIVTSDGRLACFEPGEDGAALAQRWSIELDAAPLLLRRDARSALVAQQLEDRTRIARLDIRDGSPIWTIDSLEDAAELNDGRNALRRPSRIFAADARTLALADRTGAIAEQNAGGSILPIKNSRECLRTDDQHTVCLACTNVL